MRPRPGKARPAELRAAGLGSKVVERLLELRSSLDLDKLWERILAQGIHDSDLAGRRLSIPI